MEKNYIDYKGFTNLNLVISKKNFDALKIQMLDANKYFTACQFTLDPNDKYDKELTNLLDKAKRANWDYILNVGNQIFAQTGDKSAMSIPYPDELSKLLGMPREELFDMALRNSQKVVNTLNNHLDGHLTRKGVLVKGQVSIPANIALCEEANVKNTSESLLGYFVRGLENGKEM